MTSLAVVLLFGITLVDCISSSTIPRSKYVPNSIHKYTSGLNYYWNLLLDDDSLYVGGQNMIVRLNRDNIEDRTSSVYKSVDIPSKRDEVQKCLSHSLNQAFDCENHVRVLLRRKGKYNDVFACSTNAFSPKIYYFNPDLTEKQGSKEGFGYCSRDPRHNNTALWSDEGNPHNFGFFYTGAVIDYTKTEPIIYRPPSDDGSVKFLRTPQYDTDWLSAPEFIASFDVGSNIYFFFREKAEEQRDIFPKIYSRVGRLCKNDVDTATIMANTWTTFRKARISCLSGTNESPFVFNEINSVAKLADDRFIISFTSTPGDLTTSIICEYSRRDIDVALDGNFKEADSTSFWRELPRDHVPEGVAKNCESNGSLSDTALSFLRSHVLMNGNIFSSPPMEIAFQTSDTIITRLVTDSINPNTDYPMTLIYAGTQDGQVLKLVQRKAGEKFILLTSWILDENINDKSPVRNMVLAQDTKQLYVSTDAAVYQFSVNQCNRYMLCTECERDPLCHYDVQQNRCSNVDESHVKSAIARLQPESWCKKSVQRPNKILQLTRKKGETVWLQCDVSEYLRSSIEWRWNGRNIQETLFNNYLLTKEHNLIIINMNNSLNGQYTCFIGHQPIVSYSLETDREAYVYGDVSTTITNLSRRNGECNCLTAEKYIEKYNDWCKEFENYQRAYNEWEVLRDQSCPKP
ncbi:unnamed protein product [Adineta ricciae]|uniref:Semaphorin-2A n=1 Tax=Adineta ricciae TaxID=249248 RepID=A0A814X9P9_ADIRI|nr:unnamed protein product [Adineta ricciae]